MLQFSFPIYEESYRKDVNFVYGDIRDKDKLLSVLNKNDAVIWLAALVGDGACSINPELTLRLTQNQLNSWQKILKRIVFLSTCSVYGHKMECLMKHLLLTHYLSMLLQSSSRGVFAKFRCNNI